MIDRVAPMSAFVNSKNNILFLNIGLTLVLLAFFAFSPVRDPGAGELAELWRAFCHFAVKP